MTKKIKILFILLFFISALSFAQTITVTSPHSGDTWNKGRTYTIRWTKSGTMNANVKIRLIQNGTKILGITDSTPNNGSYSWTIPANIPDGTYQIRVKTIDNAVSDDSDSFTIGVNNAYLQITSPSAGITWYKKTTYKIKWNKTGSMSNRVKIRLYRNGVKVLGITDSAPNNGIFEWTIPDTVQEASNYIIRVKTVDNLVSDDSDLFSIKNSNININTNFNKKFTPVGFPELEVYGTSLRYTGNKDGEIKIHVAVRNTGKVDVSNVPYTFIIDGPSGRYDFYSLQGHFASIPKGMTVVFDKTYVLEDEGKYKFSFEVNPNHRAFVEYRYDNNKFEKEIKYIGAPDLVVKVIVGMHSRLGFSHKVWFEVKNIGTRASSDCKLRTYIKGKGVKFFNVPHLYPGEKATFIRTVKWLTLGYKKIEAIVDYYNIIREKNENNNKTDVRTKVVTGTIFD